MSNGVIGGRWKTRKGLSRAVLIGRSAQIYPLTYLILIKSKHPGGSSGLATPVPIPNTEVKQSRADDTLRFAGGESRLLPGCLDLINKKQSSRRACFFNKKMIL